jgi:hypothetical protein
MSNFTTNESGLSTNGSKDVSISNVPAVGFRDRLQVQTVTPDGTTTATYTNDYVLQADHSWLEQVEQWLCIRHSYGYEAFATYAVSRLWFKVAKAMTLVIPTLGYIMLAAFAVGLCSLAYVAVRHPGILAASSLRLLMIVIACI